MSDKPVYVTQPYLPPLEEFVPYLEKIWESKTLTNGGPMHQQLEKELCEYLGVEHIALFNNGVLNTLVAWKLKMLKSPWRRILPPASLTPNA